MAVGIFASIANEEVAKAVAALQADIAVLREENAQLRVGRHRTGVAESLAVLRELAAATPGKSGESGERSEGAESVNEAESAGDGSDMAWQALIDVAVMRDVLLDMCAQIQSLAAQMQHRLERLGPPAGIGAETTRP